MFRRNIILHFKSKKKEKRKLAKELGKVKAYKEPKEVVILKRKRWLTTLK